MMTLLAVVLSQLPSYDIVLSSLLCKFSHNFFSFGCHPLDGVTRPHSDANEATYNDQA